MKVSWAYDGLSYRHTPQETDDPTAYEWQKVSDAELIYHAANLHLYRTMGTTPTGAPLWSLTGAPAREDRVVVK